MDERKRGDEPVVTNLLMSAKWHLPRRVTGGQLELRTDDHTLLPQKFIGVRHEDYVGAIELVEAGKVQLKPLISKIFPFAQYLDAYKYIDANRETTMKVIIAVQEK